MIGKVTCTTRRSPTEIYLQTTVEEAKKKANIEFPNRFCFAHSSYRRFCSVLLQHPNHTTLIGQPKPSFCGQIVHPTTSVFPGTGIGRAGTASVGELLEN